MAGFLDLSLSGDLHDIAMGIAATAAGGALLAASRYLVGPVDRWLERPTLVFVSTGGTCRDPMAKAIMDRLLEDRRPRVRVHAAGVARGHSRRASKAARLIVKEQLGRDMLRRHRTKALNERLANRAGLILAMTDFHAREVRKLFPVAAGKTHTISSFFGTGTEIENPYRKPDEIDSRALERYRSCFLQLEQVLSANVDRIHKVLTA